jgi:hypothetical protein
MLPLFTALADPYPSNISVTVIDENSVLVAWQDNAWAQSYHVHRNDFVAELAEDENSYLDTGLTPAVPYCYRVCSIVDGVEYTADDAIWVAPLNTPEITGTGFVPNSMDEYISIQITWTPVDHATGYVLYSMEEGEYVSLGDTLNPYNTANYFRPAESTTYRFKVRAYFEAADGGWYFSSYSEPKSITYEPIDFSRFKNLYLYEEVWPWPPWNKEWLGELLDVYGDPEKWPQGVVPGSKSLASLAQHLSEGSGLSEQEQQMIAALHPHGLALLLGAYASPPDEKTAGVLKKQLQGVSELLSKQAPDSLEGDALTRYYGQLQDMCGLVALKGTLLDNPQSLHPDFEVTSVNTQDVIFSSLPGISSLLGEKYTNLGPTPAPSPKINPALRPGKVLVKPAVTPTPIPTFMHKLKPIP